MPLPTSSDALPDKAVKASMLDDGAIGNKLGTDIVTSQPAHALEDVVHNTGSRPLLVVVAGKIEMPAQNDAAAVELLIESANPPTIAASLQNAVNANLAAVTVPFEVIGIVLPGQFYKVTQPATVGTGLVTIRSWNEYEL